MSTVSPHYAAFAEMLRLKSSDPAELEQFLTSRFKSLKPARLYISLVLSPLVQPKELVQLKDTDPYLVIRGTLDEDKGFDTDTSKSFRIGRSLARVVLNNMHLFSLREDTIKAVREAVNYCYARNPELASNTIIDRETALNLVEAGKFAPAYLFEEIGAAPVQPKSLS